MEPELSVAPLSAACLAQDGFDLSTYAGRQEFYLCVAETLRRLEKEASEPVWFYLDTAIGELKLAAEREAEARRDYERDVKAGVA